LRAIGAEMKTTCQAPAEAPLASEPQPAAAPTLVKYAEASSYPGQVARELTQAAEELLAGLDAPDRSTIVDLAEPFADPLREMAATLLYRYDARGHSYRQIQALVLALDEARVVEIFDLSLAGRSTHDEPLREHRGGYALAFDVLVDLGSFRDLHRHRRCIQIQQPFTWAHAFELPEEVFTTGLGEQAALSALEGGQGEAYVEALIKAEQAATTVRHTAPLAADYLLPLAYRTRCLFKMDWAEAAYIVEQRTQPQGHFSYRRVAWGMFEALRGRYPSLAAPIRAVDPRGPQDLLKR
jgi:hypothetical protein